MLRNKWAVSRCGVVCPFKHLSWCDKIPSIMPILIPKQRDDLVIISRKQYEELLERKKEEICLTPSQKRRLKHARKNMSRGKFMTINELKQKLEVTSR